MRFRHWDVLLFPAGDTPDAHVPLQEFCTRAFIEPARDPEEDSNNHVKVPSHQHSNGEAATGETRRGFVPLLTTFVPTLPKNSPFQISVHSWTGLSTISISKDEAREGSGVKDRSTIDHWQAQVIIDGQVVLTKTFGVHAVFPQTLTSIPSEGNEEPQILKFPRFHRRITSQTTWRPSDVLGRIRVELATGSVCQRSGGFVKKSSIANFAFQIAPLDLLEDAGIAWPSSKLHTSPLLSVNHYLNYAAGSLSLPESLAQRKNPNRFKTSMPSPFSNFTAQPANLDVRASTNPGIVYGIPNGASSRSSSAYSDFTNPIVPPLSHPSTMYPNNAQHSSKQQLYFRLPSDQLQAIINGLRAPPDPYWNGQYATTMPPPPLPPYAPSWRTPLPTEPKQTSKKLPSSEHGRGGDRHDSRYSDISMHPGCTSFPGCTSEDAQGRVIHSPNDPHEAAANIPATVVRGRKEGVSPDRSRDFFSTILEPTVPATSATTCITSTPVATTGASHPQHPFTPSSPDGASVRKRNRSALRKLGTNDGSPEKREVGAPKPPPRKISRMSGTSAAKSTNENLNEAFVGKVAKSIEDIKSTGGDTGEAEGEGIVVDS